MLRCAPDNGGWRPKRLFQNGLSQNGHWIRSNNALSLAGLATERIYSAKRHVQEVCARRIPRRTAGCRPRMSGVACPARLRQFSVYCRAARKRALRASNATGFGGVAGIFLITSTMRSSVPGCVLSMPPPVPCLIASRSVLTADGS